MHLSRSARALLRRWATVNTSKSGPRMWKLTANWPGPGSWLPFPHFASGRESIFRFTPEGWDRRIELQRAMPRFSASAIPHNLSLAFSGITKGVSAARLTAILGPRTSASPNAGSSHETSNPFKYQLRSGAPVFQILAERLCRLSAAIRVYKS
jgi:hypothetical protein